MSREEIVKIPEGADVGIDDDHFLQINLRLRLDEIAEAEAFLLRDKPPRKPTAKELASLACRMYDARRTRDQMLGRRLFGEPAWDMLLALYCLPARGEMLTITGLTYAAEAAGATGHRWQNTLMREDLIERGPDGVDARKQNVRLTAKGRQLMEGYLTKLFFAAGAPNDRLDGLAD